MKLDKTTDESIVVYPNPAKNQIIVKYQAARAGNVQLKMLNAAGATMSDRTESVRAGQNQFSINSSLLATGYYFIQVAGRDGVKMKEIMIQH